MKKKVLAIALAVALIAIMVSGTLAYFTAEDKVENTFTIGSVEIEIWENDKVTDKGEVIFEKPLVPVVNTEDVTKDPGYTAKVGKVENTGLNAAYIRVHIAQPYELLGYLELALNEIGWTNRTTDTNVYIDGQRYVVVSFDYATAVDPDAFTSELLKGAYLSADVDLKANADGDLEFCKPDGNGGYNFSGFVAHEANGDGTYTPNTVSVLVYAQAIQAQGFDDATTALDSGFGDDTNPWQ